MTTLPYAEKRESCFSHCVIVDNSGNYVMFHELNGA